MDMLNEEAAAVGVALVGDAHVHDAGHLVGRVAVGLDAAGEAGAAWHAVGAPAPVERALNGCAWVRPARIGAALASGAPDDYTSSRSVIPAEPEKAPPARRAV